MGSSTQVQSPHKPPRGRQKARTEGDRGIRVVATARCAPRRRSRTGGIPSGNASATRSGDAADHPLPLIPLYLHPSFPSSSPSLRIFPWSSLSAASFIIMFIPVPLLPCSLWYASSLQSFSLNLVFLLPVLPLIFLLPPLSRSQRFIGFPTPFPLLRSPLPPYPVPLPPSSLLAHSLPPPRPPLTAAMPS